jgi:hypothetical protein
MIHRINLALVFIIVVASIMIALPAAYSKIAYAQATIVNPKTFETFSAKGLIRSLIFNAEGAIGHSLTTLQAIQTKLMQT